MIHPFDGFLHILLEVSYALTPLFLIFLFFQLLLLRLPWEKIKQILIGFVFSFIGLAFFLQGVNYGFLPAGETMGTILGGLSYRWIIIPIGFILGFVATFAEPAVRILNQEVDKVSSGYIPENVMLFTLSFGVAVSIAFSMIRILLDIPIWYFLVPGYILAFVLMSFSKNSFAAIAFDSGGVATGPMTATFILSMMVGIASSLEGRNPLTEGFGMIALVALAPILSVLILGLLYERKEKEIERDLEP